MAKKVFLTGGSGYLGSHLLEALADHNDIEVLFSSRKKLDDTRALTMDLREESDLVNHADKLQTIEYLIHAAANVSHDKSNAQERVTDGIKIIGNLMQNLPNVKRVVLISSCSAEMADTDTSLYGLNKLVDEEILKAITAEKGIELIILRFPQIYGAHETHGTFVTKFVHALKNGESLVIENDGAVSKDILYIKDAVGSIVYALNTNKTGLYTITPEGPVTVREVLTTLESILGVKAQVAPVHVDDDVVKSKSFHFKSNANELGYNIRYTLREGLTETADERAK